MKKSDLEKNRLDLAYNRNLQIMNVVLIVGAGSFIVYLAGLILNGEKVLEYSVILAILGIITFILYNKIDDNLKFISYKIKDLK